MRLPLRRKTRRNDFKTNNQIVQVIDIRNIVILVILINLSGDSNDEWVNGIDFFNGPPNFSEFLGVWLKRLTLGLNPSLRRIIISDPSPERRMVLKRANTLENKIELALREVFPHYPILA